MPANSDRAWDAILEHLRSTIEEGEFRRWFSSSMQASDSGDQITVWVPTVNDGRFITSHYLDEITRALERLNRFNVVVRFVATGSAEDDEYHE
jgi:chromosomal replication initiation ATPase DnaA